MEESKQWEALKAGDIRALSVLYQLHADSLYRYGMVLCHDADRVRDCLHDLFLFCWTNREGMSLPTHGKAYLMVSLRRRIFEKNAKTPSLILSLENADPETLSTEDHETAWIRNEDEQTFNEKLKKALSGLSERQQEIIHMKYFQRMDYEDIARIMDLNYQSARNLVNRALTALRKEMA